MSDDLKFPELTGTIHDMENKKLRTENLELRTKVQKYEKILQDNGLLEKLSQISDEESILVTQIAKLKEVNDKGIPFQIEDIKCLEILVKTLQIARGKVPVIEEKKKKPAEKIDIGKLLKIAGGDEES